MRARACSRRANSAHAVTLPPLGGALSRDSQFLQMMTARSKKDTREEIDKVFKLFDDDGNGSISVKNLVRVAKELGESMTEEELKEMIEHADKAGTGSVSMDVRYRAYSRWAATMRFPCVPVFSLSRCSNFWTQPSPSSALTLPFSLVHVSQQMVGNGSNFSCF